MVCERFECDILIPDVLSIGCSVQVDVRRGDAFWPEVLNHQGRWDVDRLNPLNRYTQMGVLWNQ